MKRLTALLLALLLTAALPAGAFAEEPAPVVIDSQAEFLAFAAACAEERYSAGRSFELRTDVDLSNTDFEPIPYFAGTFNGNGHLILGLELRGEGSRMGLFRRTSAAAVISKLRVKGSVRPGGTAMQVGGIVGENAGSLVGCSFEGTVEGIENIGGVVGLNTDSGRVSLCRFQGELTGEHQVGGIAGRNAGLLSDCINRGAVNTVAVTPVGEQRFDLSTLSEDDFVNLANIGGVAGENLGALLKCENLGAVGFRYTGFNVGGVAGKSTGFVSGCTNNAAVTGRRDVGGIVGQLVPYMAWDFSNGKLDALAGQIGLLQQMLSSMSQNAQGMSAQIAEELALLSGCTHDALDALAGVTQSMADFNLRVADSLSVDLETGEVFFNPGALFQIDNSALVEALSRMHNEAVVLAELSRAGALNAADDLIGVSNQLSAIFGSLGTALSGMGGALTETHDLSASESYEHDVGAIDGCKNYGTVDSENHSGGVVGTVAFELAFDMDDRLNASDFVLRDAKQSLFAVVRDCGSYGDISTRGEGAGCIAGSMDIGAAVNCVGLGSARSASGDRVGGIVGDSRGSVIGCWSRALLAGEKYVGGIAGLGTDLSGCRSWAHIERAREYRGAVAGWAEGTVAENLYVPEAPAGVDGAALIGQSAPVTAEELLAMPDVPQNFDRIQLVFVASGRVVQRLELPFGGSVEQLPEVPNREDAYWKWDDFDREHLYYSQRIEGRYYSPNLTLSSGEEPPRFLVEGVFYEGQQLSAAAYSSGLEPDTVLEAATLFVNDYDGPLTVRMYAAEDGTLFRVGAGGALERLSASRDGSYLVFELENGGSVVYAREDAAAHRLLPGVLAALPLAGPALLFLLWRRKRARSAPEAGADGFDEDPAE